MYKYDWEKSLNKLGNQLFFCCKGCRNVLPVKGLLLYYNDAFAEMKIDIFSSFKPKLQSSHWCVFL